MSLLILLKQELAQTWAQYRQGLCGVDDVIDMEWMVWCEEMREKGRVC